MVEPPTLGEKQTLVGCHSCYKAEEVNVWQGYAEATEAAEAETDRRISDEGGGLFFVKSRGAVDDTTYFAMVQFFNHQRYSPLFRDICVFNSHKNPRHRF